MGIGLGSENIIHVDTTNSSLSVAGVDFAYHICSTVVVLDTVYSTQQYSECTVQYIVVLR